MKTDKAVRALAALAQATRLAIYRSLVQQGPTGKSAGEISSSLNLPPATLSFHLKELANAGLVTSRQEGRFIFYAADFGAMNDLLSFLSENCCSADMGPGCSPDSCKPSTVRRAQKASIRISRKVKA